MRGRIDRRARVWGCAAARAAFAGLIAVATAMTVTTTTARADVATIGPAATMPPETIEGVGYKNVGGVFNIVDGLPSGTTIEIDAHNNGFTGITRVADGFGGEVQNFGSTLAMDMTGTGTLAGYGRMLNIPLNNQTQSDAHNPADPVQDFDTELRVLQGQITGDAHFDLLRITAGSTFGLPSPGHTRFDQLPSTNFNVDSFFDVTYRIDFIGNPGGPLAGRSGSTTGTVRVQLGQPIPEPGSAALLALSAAAAGAARRRRR